MRESRVREIIQQELDRASYKEKGHQAWLRFFADRGVPEEQREEAFRCVMNLPFYDLSHPWIFISVQKVIVSHGGKP